MTIMIIIMEVMMFDLLSMPFMQMAIAAGVIVGFLGSYYGVFIVQRKMSFLGSGLAHAAFGGIALGLLLNSEPLWIAIPFTVAVSIAIIYIKEKTRLQTDTSIGIFFAVSVSIGIIFISMKETYASDAFTYLFGSILTVNVADLIASASIALLTLLAGIKYWGRWAYSSFDREISMSDKIPALKDDYILSVLTALTIVISVKLVGIILISSFLVIPAASARLVSGRFYSMSITAIIFGIFSSIAGLLLSAVSDLPAGATIVIVQAGIFLVCASVSGRIS